MTDFHPDPLYRPGATIESGCHDLPQWKGKGKDEQGLGDSESVEEEDERVVEGGGPRTEGFAGKWGTGVS